MSGLIPRGFIDELLARCDIVDVVGSRIPLKKAGANLHALCPFHAEKTPSFTVSPGKQFYHCFGCGAHGTVIGFVMEYDRLEFPEAVELLAGQLGLEVPREARQQASRSSLDQYRLLELADQAYRGWLRSHPQRQPAVDYLKSRGVTGAMAAEFGLGFAPDAWDALQRELGPTLSGQLTAAGLAIEREHGGHYDRFRNRIMFPIRDRRGRVVGFGGRVLGAGEPKYLNSPETEVFQKRRELYGLYECLKVQRRPERILVVEGYLDVIALAQHGFPNTVATLGTATTTTQVERLFQSAPRVVFCFDGDRAGRQAAWRALENTLPALRDSRRVDFLFLPEGHDPDSLVRLDPGRFAEALDAARPLAEYLLEELAGGETLASVDARASIAGEAARMLGKVPPGVLRDLLIDELAQRLRIGRAHLDAVIRGEPAAEAAAAINRAPPAQSTRRSMIRVAVALLLEFPELVSEALSPEALRTMDIPGAEVLADVVEMALACPHLTTSGLLQRFQGSKHERTLWRLVQWEHMTPPEGARDEFVGAMDRLRERLRKQRLQQLSRRLQTDGLTPDEHKEWRALLAPAAFHSGSQQV
jgi:DNA primase